MVNTQSDTTRLIAGFVGILIAVVLLASSADSISLQTNTVSVVNQSIVVGAVNTTVAINGRNLIGTEFTVYNLSDEVRWATELNTTWFNINTTVIGGLQTVSITPAQLASSLVGDEVNLTYTAAGAGYISDSGGRNITNLIPIIAGIAILVFSLMLIFSTNAGRNIMRGTR